MNWITELWRKLQFLRRRSQFDADLAEEIELHLAHRAEDLQAEGHSPTEARLQAQREFGPVARAQEDTRSAWHWQWLEDVLSDARYAARALRRNPGFAAAGILSLALGTGANTTVFSLTMEFLFSEPSVRDADSLAILRMGGRSHASQADYEFLRDSQLFDGVAGIREESQANWRNGSQTQRLFVTRVTSNYFDVTGASVAQGRPLAAGEQDALLISHNFWKSKWNASPNVLGRVMVLDGRPYRIAGVLPAAHRTITGFGFSPDLYMPLNDRREDVKLLARLPVAVTHAAAMDRLKSGAAQLDRIYPRPAGDHRARSVQVSGVNGLDRLRNGAGMPIAAFFVMLMTVVGLVLLVACANVASLHLARAASRRQELSVRLAIGASRGRVVRQLLAESLVMAAAGTVAGLLLNIALTSWLSGISLPLPFPISLQIDPDWRLLSYSLLVAAGCALVSGVMPALAATRGDVQSGLQRGGARQAGDGRWPLRNILVAGQLAVTVVLLTTAFLFVRNLTQAAGIHPGFYVQHTVWSTMRLVPERYPTPEAILAAAERASDALGALPGVESTALARVVPLNDSMTMGNQYSTDLGGPPVRAELQLNRVGPLYFRTLGIGLVQGREFLASDRTGQPPVAIVNEEFARRLFGARPAVGHTLSWSFARGQSRTVTIVGVARNSKYFTLGEQNTPAIYTPYAQSEEANPNIFVLVRSSRSPESVARDINRVLTALDSSAAVESRAMKDALSLAFLPSRAGAALLGSLGALGLLLASLGLYGVLAYGVNRRVREIGVRMTLGASPRDVMGLVLRQSCLLLGSGASIGLALALLATQPLALFLVPGVKPTDIWNYLGVAAVLAVVGLLATAGPAWRATQVEPTTALRWE
jgi:predicted permease